MTDPAQQPPEEQAPQGPQQAQSDPAQDGAPQEPPSPEDQINDKIDYENSPIRDIENILQNLTPWGPRAPETPSGGGGVGGDYVFTDPAQLRTIIGQWEDKHEKIMEYGEEIVASARLVQPLAADDASNGMAKSARQSLAAMAQHNAAMQKYAAAYIRKLKGALSDIEATEQDNAAASNQAYRG